MKQPQYRIRSYTIRKQDYGYVGLYSHYYQDLQIRRWWGWQTLDTEEIPSWVPCYASVGGDSGWISKFSFLGSWRRDGIVTLADKELVP